jgi:hypothetical protein
MGVLMNPLFCRPHTEMLDDQVKKQGRTKSGRLSIKWNPQTAFKLYGSKALDADDDKLLLGQKMPLGKAIGILAVVMCGPDLPTEKYRHG